MTRLFGILLTAMLALWAVSPCRAGTISCTEAAAVAELGAGIPAGMLLAIGNVESGRRDPHGVTAPWPWAIQSGGVDRFEASAEAAIAVVRGLQATGVKSIDIGCFQINLLHHPNAFADLAGGFDPLTNALAAARFLVTLHNEFGAWGPAVAAYHSRSDALGTPYREKVLAAWRGTPQQEPTARAETGIRIWGPAGEIGGAAGGSSSLEFAAALRAPRWIQMPRYVLAAGR